MKKPSLKIPGFCPKCYNPLLYRKDSGRMCRVCFWRGPSYQAIGTEFRAILEQSFSRVLDANTDLAIFEEYLQDHPKGDPSETAHRVTTDYIQRLSKLAMLRSIIKYFRLDNYEAHIMEKEISLLFPPVINRVK